MRRYFDVDMAEHTSFRAGGTAKEMAVVESPQELMELLTGIDGADNEDAASREEYVLLGNGTNTLFACDRYEGLVIKLGEAFDFVDIDGETVRVGGATLLSRLAKTVASEGLAGLEFAGGIPGSVGGAVFMNAGAYNGEIKDTIVSVEAIVRVSAGGQTEWRVSTIPAEDLDLSYRHSAFMEREGIIISATFRLKAGVKEDILANMKDLSERRISKQPLEYPSAGSFFKRPRGGYAGEMIEGAGLKGFQVGGAAVSDKHAGFVINLGGATYQDIVSLMEQVQTKVREKFGILLEPEIRIITSEPENRISKEEL